MRFSDAYRTVFIRKKIDLVGNRPVMVILLIVRALFSLVGVALFAVVFAVSALSYPLITAAGYLIAFIQYLRRTPWHSTRPSS